MTLFDWIAGGDSAACRILRPSSPVVIIRTHVGAEHFFARVHAEPVLRGRPSVDFLTVSGLLDVYSDGHEVEPIPFS